MSVRLSCFFVAIVCILAACSPYSVSHDYDSAADFTSYSSFAFKEQSALHSGGNELMAKRVRRSLGEQMDARGYERAVSNADLLIAFYLGTRNSVDVTTTSYRWRRGRPRGKTKTIRHVKEGTLVVDIVDARKNELLWRGTAVGALRDPDNADEHVREVISDMMASFPPEKD